MAYTKPNKSAAPADPQQSKLYQADLDALVQGIAGDGVVTGCTVTAQGTPNNTVAVAAGAVKIGTTYVLVSAGNVTMPSADGTNPRWVVISADNTGAKAATAGTAAAAPLLPALPANSVLLAAIWWPASDTTVASTQITDGRLFVGADPPDIRLKVSGTTFYDAPGVGIEGWRTIGYDAGRVYYYPFTVRGRSITVSELAFRVTTAATSGATGRVAIYRADIHGQPLDLLVNAVGITIDTTGKKTASVGPVTLPPGNYVRAIWFTASVSLGQRFGYGPGVGALVGNIDEFDFVRRVYVGRDTTTFTTWANPGIAWTNSETGNQGWEEVLFIGN